MAAACRVRRTQVAGNIRRCPLGRDRAATHNAAEDRRHHLSLRPGGEDLDSIGRPHASPREAERRGGCSTRCRECRIRSEERKRPSEHEGRYGRCRRHTQCSTPHDRSLARASFHRTTTCGRSSLHLSHQATPLHVKGRGALQQRSAGNQQRAASAARKARRGVASRSRSRALGVTSTEAIGGRSNQWRRRECAVGVDDRR